MVTIPQIRAARGLLGWSQVRLAEAAGVSEPTVKRAEGAKVPVSDDALACIRRAFEVAGVVFLAPGEVTGGGDGVRLKSEEIQR